MIERFSYSSLETYKKCPAQFRFRYIDKIAKTDEGIEAFMGKRVHEALEFLYNEVMSGRLIFLDGVIEKYYESWEQHWHGRIAIVRKKNKPKFYLSWGDAVLQPIIEHIALLLSRRLVLKLNIFFLWTVLRII